MSIERCIYRSYNPNREPSHPWPSWHNHTGSYPRFSFCPTAGLSIARYERELRENPDVWECFAITDHAFSIAIPDPSKCWPHNWYEDESIPDFFRETGATASRIKSYRDFCKSFSDGNNFFSGIEIEVNLNGRMALTAEEMDGYDLIVGSIHHNPGAPEDWVERHFFQFKRALSLPCDIIGHPIRHMNAHSSKENPLPRELIDETLDLVKEAGVAIEINAHYPQLHDDVLLLQGAYERDIEIAFSMDLHYPEEFGNWRYFEDVVELSEIRYSDLKLFKPKRRASPGEIS
jgi:histidinol phosphatase-like PHP family hydrolase